MFFRLVASAVVDVASDKIMEHRSRFSCSFLNASCMVLQSSSSISMREETKDEYSSGSACMRAMECNLLLILLSVKVGGHRSLIECTFSETLAIRFSRLSFSCFQMEKRSL